MEKNYFCQVQFIQAIILADKEWIKPLGSILPAAKFKKTFVLEKSPKPSYYQRLPHIYSQLLKNLSICQEIFRPESFNGLIRKK